MAVFPRPVSPRAALRDFLAVVRQPGRERWIAASCAVLVTIIIVIEFLVDSKINTAPPPQIVYIESYSANRTDAEIMADQQKDKAERDAAAKRKQEQFQQLENRLGL